PSTPSRRRWRLRRRSADSSSTSPLALPWERAQETTPRLRATRSIRHRCLWGRGSVGELALTALYSYRRSSRGAGSTRCSELRRPVRHRVCDRSCRGVSSERTIQLNAGLSGPAGPVAASGIVGIRWVPQLYRATITVWNTEVALSGRPAQEGVQ